MPPHPLALALAIFNRVPNRKQSTDRPTCAEEICAIAQCRSRGKHMHETDAPEMLRKQGRRGMKHKDAAETHKRSRSAQTQQRRTERSS
ncbi:prominin [Sesbania bispinosa]|nr:prominin [Sesbania bispinosa]